MALRPNVLRPWADEPEVPYIYRPFTAAEREATYKSITPLWGRFGPFNPFDPTSSATRFELDPPMFGWLALYLDDEHEFSARLDADFMIRLGDAKRIVYQEMAWLQADIFSNWVWYVVDNIVDRITALAGTIALLMIPGAGPVSIIIEEIWEAIGVYEFHQKIELVQHRMIGRMEMNVPPQKGMSYPEAFSHRYNLKLRGLS